MPEFTQFFFPCTNHDIFRVLSKIGYSLFVRFPLAIGIAANPRVRLKSTGTWERAVNTPVSKHFYERNQFCFWSEKEKEFPYAKIRKATAAQQFKRGSSGFPFSTRWEFADIRIYVPGYESRQGNIYFSGLMHVFLYLSEMWNVCSKEKVPRLLSCVLQSIIVRVGTFKKWPRPRKPCICRHGRKLRMTPEHGIVKMWAS